jgi:hypothetical protein
MGETVFRLRLTFAKRGRLAWLSHLELVRAIERTIRRSGLPFVLTQGFNQHMRSAFGPALPVGTAGMEERCDVWLSEYVPAEQALASLNAVQVGDLPLLAAEYVAKEAPALQVSHILGSYEIALELPAALPPEAGQPQLPLPPEAWKPQEQLPPDVGQPQPLPPLPPEAGVPQPLPPLPPEAQALRDAFSAYVAPGVVTLVKKGKPKEYELDNILVSWSIEPPCCQPGSQAGSQPGRQPGAASCALMRMTLRSSAEGSLRPEALLGPVLRQFDSARVASSVRVRLEAEEARPAPPSDGRRRRQQRHK